MSDKFRVHGLAAGKRSKQRFPVSGSDLTIIRVDPRVWQEAMRIADNDYRRIEIVSARRVIVHERRIR